MNKKYLIVSDNSFIVSFKVQNPSIRFTKGYLEIFSSSNNDLNDIEKLLIQLKLDYQYDKIEHTLKVLIDSNLCSYNIYISDKQMY